MSLQIRGNREGTREGWTGDIGERKGQGWAGAKGKEGGQSAGVREGHEGRGREHDNTVKCIDYMFHLMAQT